MGLCPAMGTRFQGINMSSDYLEAESSFDLRFKGQAVEKTDDEYAYLEELDVMNKCARSFFRDCVLAETEELFGEKTFSDLMEKGAFRILDKISADPDSHIAGAPIKARTLIAFMKLGRRIPYEVVREQEIQREIAVTLGKPIQGHKPGCECIDCGKQRAAVEVARKRVYRALKLRQKLGYLTPSMSLEQWAICERFGQKIKEVSSRGLVSAR